jgi:hypothetical protein
MTDGEEEADRRLHEAFLATAEMDAWQGLHEAMTAALAKGAERAELPLAFLKLVMPEIATTPMMFDAVKEVWNRVCDAEGLPDRKLAVPDPDGDSGGPL